MRVKWLKFWSKRFLDCVGSFLRHWECYEKTDGVIKKLHKAGMQISLYGEIFCDKMCDLV